MSAKDFCLKALNDMDVRVGGKRAQDIIIHDERVYKRVLAEGDLGLGEAYMDGWWDANSLDEFIARAVTTDIGEKLQKINALWHVLHAKFFNLQNNIRAKIVGEHHYDAKNDVFIAMLGGIRAYTCAYYNGKEKSLEEAQFDKHELVCKKLGIKGGERILDIGCGNGEFMYHAASRYNASEVVGLTVSRDQTILAREKLEGYKSEFFMESYHTLDPKIHGMFDHIISIGMAEQVGNKNFSHYLEKISSVLKPNGLFVLHTIVSNSTQDYGGRWLNKYIFPNGSLPSLSKIIKASEGQFIVEDVHNFGVDYDTTLMNWWGRFKKAWPELKHNYNERFYRMWEYYLRMCAGLFRARYIQVIQIVFSLEGVRGGYHSVR